MERKLAIINILFALFDNDQPIVILIPSVSSAFDLMGKYMDVKEITNLKLSSINPFF